MNSSLILKMFLPEILVLLQATVKNPSSVATEKDILLAIRDTINAVFPGQ